MQLPIDTTAFDKYDVFKDLPLLDRSFFNNSVYAYLLTVATFVVLWAAMYFLRRFAARRVAALVEGEKASDIRAFIRTLVDKIQPHVFFVVALYAASQRLTLGPTLEKGLKFLVLWVVTFQVIRLLAELVAFLIMRTKTLGRADDAMAKNTSQNIVVLAKFLLWTAGILFLLDNAGFNVSTFIAGLGIGGVAIALATQAILGDTFNSFAIALDKPFEVGDFITVDSLSGTVEHIGLKSTRVRGSGGELLVFSNSDLTKSRIRNFKRMQQRRVSFLLRVPFDTPAAKLASIPALLKTAIEGAAETRYERAYLKDIGDYAFVYDASYFVLKPDFGTYAEAQQAINLALHAAFAKLGIGLALPAGTAVDLK